MPSRAVERIAARRPRPRIRPLKDVRHATTFRRLELLCLANGGPVAAVGREIGVTKFQTSRLLARAKRDDVITHRLEEALRSFAAYFGEPPERLLETVDVTF